MRIKSCPVKIKAAGPNEGTADGVFEAIVATWDLDSVGDKIVKGAFAESLQAWAASGDPIPVYWSHRMDDPDFNIGHVLEIAETDEGLWVKAQLDLETPKAVQTYRLLKGRRVTQFSFAYDLEDYAIVKSEDADPYWELRRIKLHEVGPTPIGANQETDLLDVKSQSLSTKDHGLVRDIARLAEELLGGVASSGPSETEKAKPQTPPAASTPLEGEPVAPARLSSASLRLRTDLEAAMAGVSLTD